LGVRESFQPVKIFKDFLADFLDHLQLAFMARERIFTGNSFWGCLREMSLGALEKFSGVNVFTEKCSGSVWG